MTGLIRQREKSVARERALSAAGGLLVAATEPQDIVIAALQARRRLRQGERRGPRVPDLDGDQVRAMALDESGALTDWALSGGDLGAPPGLPAPTAC